MEVSSILGVSIQWNPSKPDTIGTVSNSEVSSFGTQKSVLFMEVSGPVVWRGSTVYIYIPVE